MKIQIRPATIHDFPAAGAIMRQVQQLHIDWRPDIYKQCETVLPLEEFEQAVHDQTFYVAEYEGRVAGILFIIPILPAPMFKWPTSELPICPSGNPTERPLA